jgi:hypothetical protein
MLNAFHCVTSPGDISGLRNLILKLFRICVKYGYRTLIIDVCESIKYSRIFYTYD